MLCDECGKLKATVHLTEIVNEQITKLNLCEVCAKQKGSDAEQHFGIADLLAALSDVETGPASASNPATSRLKCTACGIAYEDFKKVGRLGCGECYTVFRANLSPLLKRIHGAVQHMGKSPTPGLVKEQKNLSKLQDDLNTAKQDLQKAVKKEEFEEAAALRDKIKSLERKLRDPRV